MDLSDSESLLSFQDGELEANLMSESDLTSPSVESRRRKHEYRTVEIPTKNCGFTQKIEIPSSSSYSEESKPTVDQKCKIEYVKGHRGHQGDNGPRGYQGYQGYQGFQGDIGKRGHQGESGKNGECGLQGGMGHQGFQGADGSRGQQGHQGEKGDRGHHGNEGLQGPEGLRGNIGMQGERGYQGLRGHQGDRGKDGRQGCPGLQGEPGEQGLRGHQGDVGERGATGSQGYQGEMGREGLRGQQGFQGEIGDQGLRGFQGDRGPPGIICGGNSSKVRLSIINKDTRLDWSEEVIIINNRAETVTLELPEFIESPDGSQKLLRITAYNSGKISHRIVAPVGWKINQFPHYNLMNGNTINLVSCSELKVWIPF